MNINEALSHLNQAEAQARTWLSMFGACAEIRVVLLKYQEAQNFLDGFAGTRQQLEVDIARLEESVVNTRARIRKEESALISAHELLKEELNHEIVDLKEKRAAAITELDTTVEHGRVQVAVLNKEKEDTRAVLEKLQADMAAFKAAHGLQ